MRSSGSYSYALHIFVTSSGTLQYSSLFLVLQVALRCFMSSWLLIILTPINYSPWWVFREGIVVPSRYFYLFGYYAIPLGAVPLRIAYTLPLIRLGASQLFQRVSLLALPVGEPFGLVLGMVVSHSHLVPPFSSAPNTSTIPKADIVHQKQNPWTDPLLSAEIVCDYANTLWSI